MEKEYIPDITYPTEEEIRAAQLLCCGRVCKECETPAAYALRKREVDMALLLEKAIENELTENERIIIEDRWYNLLSFSEIARERKITPAAVLKTSERALEKLEKVLKYVVFYQNDIIDECIVPLTVERARSIVSARKFNADETGIRLRNLRIGRGVSVRAMSKATGIDKKRIEGIEAGSVPETDELMVLSGFFAVTIDYILKGEHNV